MFEFYFMIAVMVVFTVLFVPMYIYLVRSKQYKFVSKWKFVWVTLFTVGLVVGDLVALVLWFA